MSETPPPSIPQKPPRPRDELGRPLSRDAENVLELEDYDSMTWEENHRLGMEHLNAGRFFPAHEAWETAWKQLRGDPDEEFFKGLSQLGAGYVHYLRGNPHGATTLLRRAIGRIGRYPPKHHGVDTVAVVEAARATADRVEAGGETDPAQLDPPRI